MDALGIVRIAWVVVVAVLALVAVVRVPLGLLWMPAVASTEAGYLLALLALPAFTAGLDTMTGRSLALVGMLCVAVLLSPLVRVRAVAAALPGQLAQAFGGGAPRASSAFSMSRLLAFGGSRASITTHVYATPEAGAPLRFDFYRDPDRPGRLPIVVLIHGGSWSRGDRTQLPGMAHRLAGDGWAVAAIDYRLAPRHRFPAQLDDVRAAVDYLRVHAVELGIDRERVVLYGRSAGGHLALLAAYRWHAPFVRGVVALYAPTDLRWSWAHPTNPLVLDTHGTLRAFLGGAPDESATMSVTYGEASPIDHVTEASPPTLLVHGGRDELVNPLQTERLAARLAEAGVPHLALRLPWATHGCEASLAGPSGQLVEFAVRDFLARVGAEVPVRDP